MKNPRNTSKGRLIIILAAVVLTITLITSLPAYLIISSELEKQAWERISDGEHITLALLESEEARINNLTTLISQRPTLHRLLEAHQNDPDQETDELSEYLNVLQSGGDIDILVVQDTSDEITGGETNTLYGQYPQLAEPIPHSNVEFFALPKDIEQAQLALLGYRPIIDEANNLPLGYLIAGVILDDVYLEQLAELTGLEQTFFIDDQWVASSKPATAGSSTKQAQDQDIPAGWLVRPVRSSDRSNDRSVAQDLASGEVITEGKDLRRKSIINDSHYFSALFPIAQTHDDRKVYAEVSLMVEGLRAAQLRALFTVIVTIMVLAIAGSTLGGLYFRRITTQLDEPLEVSESWGDTTNQSKDDANNENPGNPREITNLSEEYAAHNLRTHFLANITHEFRTPLSSLNASVEYLLEEFELLSQDEIKALLTSIHLSVTGLQTLIDNLLESTSIEAGRFTIHPQNIEVSQVITEAIRIMQPLMNRRKQQVQVIQPDQLPLINSDATRLTQVMVNLLSNASKYGPMEQVIEIKISPIEKIASTQQEQCLQEGASYRCVRVAVADRGPGIPAVDKQNLFCRFTHVDRRDDSQHGIGLGLAVVKTIIEEHGGEVGVSDRPGGGSIFWFTVPTASQVLVLSGQVPVLSGSVLEGETIFPSEVSDSADKIPESEVEIPTSREDPNEEGVR